MTETKVCYNILVFHLLKQQYFLRDPTLQVMENKNLLLASIKFNCGIILHFWQYFPMTIFGRNDRILYISLYSRMKTVLITAQNDIFSGVVV